MKKKPRIAFVSMYPFDTAPGQRFRYEQYLSILENEGFIYDLFPFFDEQTYYILYKNNVLQKVWRVVIGYLKRLQLLFTISNYDYVFVYREIAPLGLPVFEWFISQVLGKKMIVDFDDAIWLPSPSSANRWIQFLRMPSKLKYLCQWSYKVSCGNTFLANYAKQFNPKTFVIPTTIDTLNHHHTIKEHKNQVLKPVVIGWTGSFSTMIYLESLYPILDTLAERYYIKFNVISNQAPKHIATYINYIPWHKQTEISDLLSFDIGVMPLSDNQWAAGKCGFKALQYMALGMPVVASPVGVNQHIVQHQQNGYLANTPTDWVDYLSQLIESAPLRAKLGQHGRQFIEANYAVKANKHKYLQLFS